MIGTMPDEDLVAPSDATIISEAHKAATITDVGDWHNRRHEVTTMTEADTCWEQGRWVECAERCYQVLRAAPFEAIEAKCHMYLSTEEVGPKEMGGQLWHANKAIELWRIVIDRSGMSRFPIEKARPQLEVAEEMLVQADEAFESAHRLLQQQRQEALILEY
ncbi:hypothetical protein LTR78_007129 [Recurvomyces mirabilis]|uniref:Uncharacterized protein n=1 Tax=Recurvomyces mirabilis TaxID=574656 RepID=A0AAE0WJU8_9PEZI|nr:hypothetical protein LTR78_007129 [Recurvomyces mirabilis]KAK5150899.1 hypothetical protein LTS14_009702 [Recurvomyces mirabilis]